MIPGGGVGLFNGCAGLFSGNMGATYGGLLSDCENEVGWDGDLLTKRKQCLQKKCEIFSQSNAKQGCLFLANWMQAAGNPTLDYEPTSCPSALTSKF